MDQDRFDQLAASWDVAPIHVARTRDVAALMRRRIPLAGLVALEVGAGTGLLSFALADDLGSVVATDPSQGMIDVLEDKIRQSGAGNVRALRCGDDLSEVGPGFGLAMLQMALHHVPDVPGFLDRVRGRLAPGGYLAIADLDAEDGSFHGAEVADVHRGFDRTALEASLRDAGFAPLSMETAHVMRRDRGGEAAEYPIFLSVSRLP